MADVQVLANGAPDGTTACLAGEKFSLYGETPVVQPAPAVAVGTDIATVILELADLRAALVSVGIIAA